jgi:hypothetical protein
VRDDEGKLKVACFGSLNVIKVSDDKLQMAQPITKFDGRLHLIFCPIEWLLSQCCDSKYSRPRCEHCSHTHTKTWPIQLLY